MSAKTKALIVVSMLVLLAGSLGAGRAAIEVVDLSVDGSAVEVSAGGTADVTVIVAVAPGWHINAHVPTLPTLIATELDVDGPPGVRLVDVVYPEPTHESFAFAGQELAVYEDVFTLEVTIAAASDMVGSGDLRFALQYQACDNEVCLPPASAEVIIPLRIGPPLDHGEAGVLERTPPLADNMVARLVGERGFPLALAVVFVLGLGLNLTPCVYPMIPITVGYFGQQAGGQGRRTVLMALSYQLGIVIAYSVLGTVAAHTGGLLGALLQQPWVLAVLATVMVVLSLSLLGLYQIRPPTALTRAVTGRARSGIPGALAMGLVAGVVAAPCVAPVSVALLTYVGATGNPWVGLSLFGALSLGLGLPYVGLALLSGRLKHLPRGGTWTVWVERVLGVVLLGVALYFISPLLPRQVTRWAGAALALGGGVYLGWLAVRGPAGRVLSVLRMAVCSGGLVVAVLLVLPGSAGDSGGLAWEPFSASSLDNADQPVVLYFYADWCVPCGEMNHSTFRDEDVHAVAERLTLMRVDLTRAGDPEAAALTKAHAVWGVPTFVVLDRSGIEVARAAGYQDAAAFAELLRQPD